MRLLKINSSTRRHQVTRLIAALVCATFSAVSAAPSTTVTDCAGRKVKVPTNVKRMVTIGPGATRLAVYLQVTGRLAGIEQSELETGDIPARPYMAALSQQTGTLPVIGIGGAGKQPYIERLLVCRPDVAFVIGLDKKTVHDLELKTRIPFVILSYGDLGVWRKDAEKSLKLMGKVLGVPERARSVLAYITSLKKDLKKRSGRAAKGSPAKTIYCGGIARKGAQGITSSQAGYPPAKMVDALHVTDRLSKEGHVFLDREQLLVWNPDIIFLDWHSRDAVAYDFERHPAFYNALKAFQTEHCYTVLPYNFYNTNIELALINAYFIGKTLHPEAFSDIDITAKSREILHFFVGDDAPETLPAFRRFSPAEPLLHTASQ